MNSSDSKPEISIEEKINQYSEKYDTDILVCYSDIKRGECDDYVIRECRKRQLRKNILLLLTTRGGDPDAGYRFARCLQEAYKTKCDSNYFKDRSLEKSGNFQVLIDGMCKSAGTLICLGADELIMSGNGELGPIDVQLRKKDEVGENESGLTPLQALQSLEQQAYSLFSRHFIQLRFKDFAFSTKMAAKIASEITTGLLSQVYAQIDPIRLAEVDRSMRIAAEYGVRLINGNLSDNDAFEKLLTGYPSHGFVIDREEAKKLFVNVKRPTEELIKIVDDLRELALGYTVRDNLKSKSFFGFISKEKEAEIK